MAHQHILLLTLHNPAEFPFLDWAGTDVPPASFSLVMDRESVSDDTLAALQAQSAFGFVRAYSNYLNNGNVYADLERLHRQRPFTHIVVFGEDDILRAAHLRERWGLSGQGVDNAAGFRDKSLTRARVREAGIPVHAGAPLGHPLALLDFVAHHGLPVYVKPRTSSGSVFGRKISDQAALTAFLETGFAPRVPYGEYVPDLCVETFQPGELYHVDGLCVDGEILWSWPSKYLTTGLEIGAFAHEEVVGSRMLGPANPLFAPLNAYACSVCHALELPHGHTFHAEVFVSPDGELSLCEIACRTGGGRINETLHTSGGPNLNQLQFLIQTGALDAAQARALLQASEPVTLCGWMLIPRSRACARPCRISATWKASGWRNFA